MASIQQSMNTLFGSLAGGLTAGSYIVRQTPAYQAYSADKQADRMSKQFHLDPEATIEGASPEERERMKRAGEAITKKREEALALSPTGKRLEGVRSAEQALSNLKEGITEAETNEKIKADEELQKAVEDEQRQKEAEAYMEQKEYEEAVASGKIREVPKQPSAEEMERQKAEQTARDIAMSDERLRAVGSRTLEYQTLLYEIRKGGNK